MAVPAVLGDPSRVVRRRMTSDMKSDKKAVEGVINAHIRGIQLIRWGIKDGIRKDITRLPEQIFCSISSMGDGADIVNLSKVCRVARHRLSFVKICHYRCLRNFANFIRIERALRGPPTTLAAYPWSIARLDKPAQMLYTVEGEWVGTFDSVKEKLNLKSTLEKPVLGTPLCPASHGYVFLDTSSLNITHYKRDSSSISQWTIDAGTNLPRNMQLMRTINQFVLSDETESSFFTFSSPDEYVVVAYWQVKDGVYCKLLEMNLENVNIHNASFFRVGKNVILRHWIADKRNRVNVYYIHQDSSSIKVQLLRDEMLGDAKMRPIVNAVLASTNLTYQANQFIGSFQGLDGTWNIGSLAFTYTESGLKLEYVQCYQLAIPLDSEIRDIKIVATTNHICIHYSQNSSEYTTEIIDASTFKLKHVLTQRSGLISCKNDLVVTESLVPEPACEIYSVKLAKTLRHPLEIRDKLLSAHVCVSDSSIPYSQSKMEITFTVKQLSSIFSKNFLAICFSELPVVDPASLAAPPAPAAHV